MILRKISFLHQKLLFPRKKWFSVQNLIFGPEISFSALGPPKKLPERCVYVGFWAGRPKVPFFGEMSDSGAQNPKMGIISPVWPPKRWFLFIRHGFYLKCQVFPRKYQWFWHVENHDFHENFMIFMKFSFSHGKRGKGFLLFSEKSCFRTRAAGCRECCLNQWNTIHFGGSWAPWAPFLRKNAFSLKSFKNVEKVKNHEILNFQWKSEISCEIMTLQKHQ